MAKKLTGGNGWSFEPAAGAGVPEPASLPPDKQKATVKLEKRAKGKEVTVIAGFVLSDADRRELAAKLRKACGAGGSDGRDEIAVQGDHRHKVADHLSALGWRIR